MVGLRKKQIRTQSLFLRRPIGVRCFLLAWRSCRKLKKFHLTISLCLPLSTNSCCCCCCCCCCYREVRAAMSRDLLLCRRVSLRKYAADSTRSPRARYLHHKPPDSRVHATVSHDFPPPLTRSGTHGLATVCLLSRNAQTCFPSLRE